MKKHIIVILYLAILTLISGSLLYSLHQYTQPRIQERKHREQMEALKLVLPQATTFKAHTQPGVFIGMKNDRIVGYVFKEAPKGYGGKIDLLVGISNDLVTGVTILSHNETPGLGALATDPQNLKGRSISFLGQFQHKPINDSFKAKQDIVALTGATITSEAVACGVRSAIKTYKSL